MADLDFSIIVPVRNRPDDIRLCVASLYRVDYAPTKYEVIVVDNGSTDDTARAAARAGARVVNEPEPNRCLARNLGAKLARGRWLVFTDSDCEADAGWLKAIAEAQSILEAREPKTRVGVIAGQVVPGEPRSLVEAYIAERAWIDQEKFLDAGRPKSPPFAATANLAIRADLFKEIGGFDPALSIAGEDADWCWRARSAGWPIHYARDAKVIHHHRSTGRELLRQAYNYGLGNADLFAKYRRQWGVMSAIELRRYAWAMKGLLKSPYSFMTGRTPLEKRLAWYDFLSNSAQAAGRLRGAIRHRVIIL